MEGRKGKGRGYRGGSKAMQGVWKQGPAKEWAEMTGKCKVGMARHG